MGYRSIDSDIIDHLREYIDMLNEESQNGSVIVVEGKRDVVALSRVGFNGNVTVFHHFRGITDFVDNYHLNRKKIILLLDMDKKGKQLTSKLVTRLQVKETMSLYSTKEAWQKLLMERLDMLKTL